VQVAGAGDDLMELRGGSVIVNRIEGQLEHGVMAHKSGELRIMIAGVLRQRRARLIGVEIGLGKVRLLKHEMIVGLTTDRHRAGLIAARRRRRGLSVLGRRVVFRKVDLVLAEIHAVTGRRWLGIRAGRGRIEDIGTAVAVRREFEGCVEVIRQDRMDLAPPGRLDAVARIVARRDCAGGVMAVNERE